MHASLWSCLSYFLGRGFHQNPACIFPETQVFFKIICFPLREIEIKWFSWALGETLGVFNQWTLTTDSFLSQVCIQWITVWERLLAYIGNVVRNKPRTFWLLSRILPTLRRSIEELLFKEAGSLQKRKGNKTKQSALVWRGASSLHSLATGEKLCDHLTLMLLLLWFADRRDKRLQMSPTGVMKKQESRDCTMYCLPSLERCSHGLSSLS